MVVLLFVYCVVGGMYFEINLMMRRVIFFQFILLDYVKLYIIVYFIYEIQNNELFFFLGDVYLIMK